MSNIVKDLYSKNLIKPPKWLPDNVHYLTIMGSQAYSVANDDSDCDVYGFCIPNKEILFPHLAGYLPGFDQNIPNFEQWSEHHIKNGDKEYDFSIYNIVKYFRLCADGNPNMVDSLFTPVHCILHMSPIGQMVRENRKLFLSKKCWHTFKGYAFSQMTKIKQKNNASSPKRQETIQMFGYDVKFAYHLIRLMQEIEMILLEGDLDLGRGNETLKAIRKGTWEEQAIYDYFEEKIKSLEKVYVESNVIPHKPEEVKLKELLVNCLEEHYGSLGNALERPNKEKIMLDKIQMVLEGKI